MTSLNMVARWTARVLLRVLVFWPYYLWVCVLPAEAPGWLRRLIGVCWTCLVTCFLATAAYGFSCHFLDLWLSGAKISWPLAWIRPILSVSLLFSRNLESFGKLSTQWCVCLATTWPHALWGAPLLSFLTSTLLFMPLHVAVARYRKNLGHGHGHTNLGTAQWLSFTAAAAPSPTTGGATKGPSALRAGLILGAWPGLMGRLRNVHYCQTHVVTCASTGAGKGIGCIVPNLLEYPGSVVCLDPKGENFHITAQARARQGQKVVCLDPFSVTRGRPASVNLLAEVNPQEPSCISEVAVLAEALIVREGSENSFWDDAASHLLQGLMLAAAARPNPLERDLGTVRSWLTLPAPLLLDTLTEIVSDRHACFGATARLLESFLAKHDRERSSVLSTALRHTHFLEDPQVRRVLAGSDSSFRFSELKTSKGSVYLVLPPDKFLAYRPLARVLMGAALSAMSKTAKRPPHDVLFLFDEFSQLGPFPQAEQAVSILRGYGVKLWFVLQDLGQLKALYPRSWSSFLSNATLQFFGVQDLETSRYVSQMLGTTTAQTSSQSQSRKKGWFERADESHATSQGMHARPLCTPDEVRTLPQEHMVVFAPGLRPAQLRRLDYRQDRRWRTLAGEHTAHMPA